MRCRPITDLKLQAGRHPGRNEKLPKLPGKKLQGYLRKQDAGRSLSSPIIRPCATGLGTGEPGAVLAKWVGLGPVKVLGLSLSRVVLPIAGLPFLPKFLTVLPVNSQND